MHQRNTGLPDRTPTRRATTGATAALALVAALALSACGSGSSGSSGSGGDGGGKEIAIDLTDAGCSPKNIKTTAGPATFKVTNAGTDKMNEMEVLNGALILGERENITAGLSGSFSLELEPGTYEISCNDGSNHDPTGKLTVSGNAATATSDPVLRKAAVGYADYVRRQADIFVKRTKRFAAAVKAGDVQRAKQLYETARVPYERIEPVAEAFGDLDPAIDARRNDVESVKEWTGFHPIEQALWVRNTTKGTEQLADGLVANTEKLRRLVAKTSYDPVQLANGAVELLNEVSQSKITGEEERYSHVDLTTFAANVEGAKKAFELLEPGLSKQDAALAKKVRAKFANVQQALSAYHVKGEVYENYANVDDAQRRKLSQAVDALALPLAQIGGKIVGQ